MALTPGSAPAKVWVTDKAQLIDILVLVHDHVAIVILRVPNGANGICVFIEFAGSNDALDHLNVIVHITFEANNVHVVDAFGGQEVLGRLKLRIMRCRGKSNVLRRLLELQGECPRGVLIYRSRFEAFQAMTSFIVVLTARKRT